MAGAATSLMLLIQTGVNPLSLSAAVITCTLTTASVLIFADRRPR
jgi:hypothetical protein